MDKQINLLIEDSVGLLKTRMTELGINSGYYTKDLLSKAKEIIFRHRELQAKALRLQSKVINGENVVASRCGFWPIHKVGLICDLENCNVYI